MVVLVLSEDSCQREQGGGEARLAGRKGRGQWGLPRLPDAAAQFLYASLALPSGCSPENLSDFQA